LDCEQGFQNWEDSFALWQELEENKKSNGIDIASMDDVINLDDKGECLGNSRGDGLASVGHAHWLPGHKASKADIAC
jgi:hypothetical protein